MVRRSMTVVVFAVVASLLALAGWSGSGNAQSLRPSSEWTLAKPATLAEIEAELEKHRGESFTYVGNGGASQAADRRAWFDRFEQKFGIRILEDTNPNSARVQAMVRSGNVTWDVVSLGSYLLWDLGQIGMLAPLDFRVVDRRDYHPSVKTPWGGGGGMQVWGTVLAYRDGVKPPTSWADFWDVEGFPGRRGYGDYLTGHLELPLLALGMKPSEIRFPLAREEEERVFRKLEELAPHVAVFWRTGSDCPQLLIRGELDYCSAWNGRISDAQKQGAPIKICWSCGWAAGTNAFSIPKGAPNHELAQLFIAWTTFLENAVERTRYISYAPAVAESAVPKMTTLLSKYLDKDALAEVAGSESNRPYMLIVDEKWEGDNFDRLVERYRATFRQAR